MAWLNGFIHTYVRPSLPHSFIIMFFCRTNLRMFTAGMISLPIVAQCGRIRTTSSFINGFVKNHCSVKRTLQRSFPWRNLSTIDPNDCGPLDETVLNRTRGWIENVVVGLNLCPFAERPMKRGQVTIDVVRGADEEEILASVLYHMIKLSSPDVIGTSIIVSPDLYADDFFSYMELVQYIEDIIPKHDLDGIIQLAPFHPLFEFAGEDSSDISTYTNKSPYPMFHILREEEVSAAVKQLDDDSSQVWKRNIGILESLENDLGAKSLRKWLSDPTKSDDSIKKVIKAVLDESKRNKFESIE